MKQHITLKQWKEVYRGGDKLLIPSPIEGDDKELIYSYMNIGGMIEFLGDDMRKIDFYEGLIIVKAVLSRFTDKELCDALWASVKQKLCQK